MISSAHLQVAVDIGSRTHYLAIGHSEGQVVDEFTIPHTQEGFSLFFHRLDKQERLYALSSAYREQIWLRTRVMSWR